MDSELKVYNLIKENETNYSSIFILINPYEIDLLKRNRIQIKGVTFQYYDKWDRYNSYNNVINFYKEKKHDGNIYLLDTGPIQEYQLKDFPKDSNIYIETNFNSLKYLSQFNTEVIRQENKNDELNNQIFLDKLKKDYMTSLFYCDYNTGIIGIEGYVNFHEKFYKYIDSVKNIYIINNNKYHDSEFIYWLLKSEYKDKIKYIEINVGKLFQTNPELIAYYRVRKDTDRDNYITIYKEFNNYMSKITDQITIGSDSYKYNSNDFPEDITHIINVSDDEIESTCMPNNHVVYEYYPISEREKDNNKKKKMLLIEKER